MLLTALILTKCPIAWLPLMHPDIHNPSTNFWTLPLLMFLSSLLLLLYQLMTLAVSKHIHDERTPCGRRLPRLVAVMGGLVSLFVIIFCLPISNVPLSVVCVSQSYIIRVTCNSTNYASVVIFVQFSIHSSKSSIREVCDPAFQVSGLRKVSTSRVSCFQIRSMWYN